MDFITQTLTIIFWFLVIIIPLVAFHELGHLIMSRLVGVKVLEYGIGVPPRWIYKRWKGIIWSLNYVLLGGFIRIYGDHDAIDIAQDTAKKDVKKAKKEYLDNRFAELIANQEVRFFLEENNIEYDETWAAFENSKIIKSGKSSEAEITALGYEPLINQLKTLIDWEFDLKIKSKEAFFSKNWFQQALIIMGGITFNLIAAVLLFFVMFTVTGSIPLNTELRTKQDFLDHANIDSKSQYLQVPFVLKGGLADKAGVKSGDELISIAGNNLENIASIEEFRGILNKNADQEVTLVFKNADEGEFKTSKVLLEKNQKGEVVIGVSGLGYKTSYKAKNLWGGLVLSTKQTADYLLLNFRVLGDIAVALLPQTQDRTALEYVNGPIAASSISAKIFTEYGVSGILFLMAIISIGLAAFNILPLPALDGGRLVIVTLNKILGKQNQKWEAMAISITLLLMLGLGILIAFQDVRGIIDGRF